MLITLKTVPDRIRFLTGKFENYFCVKATLLLHHLTIMSSVGLGGLGVTCSPREPRFAGSNPTEIGGFFSRRKNPEHKSSVKDFKLGVSSLRFQAR